ncbi:hypothetical protein [Halobellus inordinatus]|uniref:hypothetical protein n=1 Tax=Halobellus inordinatus TaxID=1126236 RepID=UPI00210D005E|nr:hypothetical protein [Halobellus inordinatus]
MVVVDFEDGIPLPIGTQLNTPGRRVHANPLIRLLADDIEVHSSTKSGWPTIILGEQDDSRIGVAVDYPGDWHEGPIDEINIVLTEDQNWSAVVAYRNQTTAIEDGNYEIDNYEGYELHEWNPETHPEVIEDCVDREVTPIFYTADAPDSYNAHTYQLANSYRTLKRMFGLSRYSQIEDRQERLYTLVVPQDVRWEKEDRSMQKLAKDILNQDSDS